ncbi:MAG: peptidylprolyl isomerase [Candidatus Krumholzibacteriia bacterium]
MNCREIRRRVRRPGPAATALAAAAMLAGIVLLGACRDDSPADGGGEGTGPAGEEASEAAAASHVLVTFRGCVGAPADLARTRAQAEEIARRIVVLLRTRRGRFEELARKNSDDPRTAERGGYLGVFRRGEALPEIELTLFALQEGQVGGPVETPFGFHVLRREPVQRIRARHILVQWTGAKMAPAALSRTRAEAAAAAAKWHGRALAEPEQFCRLALECSDDASNRARCGDLGWVEPGALSPEIDSVLFHLEPGEVSPVIESVYGFHIFRRE